MNDGENPLDRMARLALERGMTAGGDPPGLTARFHELVARHRDAGSSAAVSVMAAIREFLPGSDVHERALMLVYVVFILEQVSPEFAREVTDETNREDGIDGLAELYKD